VALAPPQPTFAAIPTWWSQYGKQASITITTMSIFSVIVGSIIAFLCIYRNLYKEQKDLHDHLADEVADLDQYAGGFGMADGEDDLDMVANPMVIEMEKLQEQINNVNAQMGNEADVAADAAEIDHLELERQRLFQEIARIKASISKGNQQKAPTRAVETGQSMGSQQAATKAPVAAAKPAASRHKFGQMRAPKKKKNF